MPDSTPQQRIGESMKSKKMLYWTGAIAAAVVLLMILIVTLDKNDN